MLTNTFRHLPGIGAKTERRLWEAGILEWEGLSGKKGLEWSNKRSQALAGHLQASRAHLESGDPGYFTDRLPPGSHWRIFPEFRSTAVYLDIETDGLDRYAGSVTTIALYDGRQVSCYVKDRNLEKFETDVKSYDLIISYNGKSFDIPFIESSLGVRLSQSHIDLRYVLSSLGLQGGLKRCESLLGIGRGDLAGLDGYWAVWLWREYQYAGNPKALDTLLAYNVQDVINLERLMVTAYNRKISRTPLGDRRRLAVPDTPENPFKPDRETIDRIRKRLFFGVGDRRGY